MFRIILISMMLISILNVSCDKKEAVQVQDNTKNPDLDLLLKYMTGSFSSREQAESDTDYFEIRLEMVQIWKERTDGYWLYVEQAAAGSFDKPYRQRIYNIYKNEDGSFQDDIYVFREPLRFAGAFKKENPLNNLNHDSLGYREGCSIVMVKEKSGLFIGGTMDNKCASSLAGATYTTTEIKIGPDQLYIWERGYNTESKQVWGAKNGGYIFKKLGKQE
ncbi:MAG: chromophore lyase CpcT/CpeT [Candidatus Zixiibacteriota bacterium]